MSYELLYGGLLIVLLFLAMADVALVAGGMFRVTVGLQRARHTLLRRSGGDPTPVSVVVPLPVGPRGFVERGLALDLVERLCAFDAEIEVQLVVRGDVDAWQEIARELELLRELSAGRVLDASASRYRVKTAPRIHVMFTGKGTLAHAYDVALASAYYPQVCLFPPRQVLDQLAVAALVRSLENENLAAFALAAPSTCLSIFDRESRPTLLDLRSSAASRLGGVRWCGGGSRGYWPDAIWPAPILVRRQEVVDLGGLSALCREGGLSGDSYQTVAPALGRLLAHLKVQGKPFEIAIAGDARSEHLGEPTQMGEPIWLDGSRFAVWRKLAVMLAGGRYVQIGGALVAILMTASGHIHGTWLGLTLLLALGVPAAAMLVALLIYEWIVPMAGSSRQLLAMSFAALIEGSVGRLPRAHGEAG